MRFLMTILCSLTLVMTAVADAVTELRPAINEAAAAYGVDPVLMEAIIRNESGHATSHAARNKNNLAGIMGRNGQRRYASQEECVQDLARILANYKAKGKVTIPQIARTYCTSHGEWTRAVSAHVSSIRAGKWGELDNKTEKQEG